MQTGMSAKVVCNPQTPFSRCSCTELCPGLCVLTPSGSSDGDDKKERPKEALVLDSSSSQDKFYIGSELN